jgi:hypothetical protein
MISVNKKKDFHDFLFFSISHFTILIFLFKGIYFSDSFEESSSYSSGLQKTNSDGKLTHRSYMLLCEVALGHVKELQNNYETIDTLPAGYDSVKALGRLEPCKSGQISMPNGAVCPLGQLVDATETNMFGRWQMLSNNQYVVYDEAQVVIRYIVQYES